MQPHAEDTGLVRAASAGPPPLDYYLYLPRNLTPNSPLLIAVHGNSRRAALMAETLVPVADALGVALVAPLFDSESYPDYQRLGRVGRGARADRGLLELVGALGSAIGSPLPSLLLFGYSGGAQFAHRFALAYPERVAGLVAAAAGWYTFPDAQRAYPRGTRVGRSLPGVRMRPKEFARIPALITVGEQDQENEPGLRRSEKLDAQQGTTRVARALRFVAAIERVAQDAGLPSRISVGLQPLVGHSFEASASGLLDLTQWFFRPLVSGSPRTAVATPSQRGPK